MSQILPGEQLAIDKTNYEAVLLFNSMKNSTLIKAYPWILNDQSCDGKVYKIDLLITEFVCNSAWKLKIDFDSLSIILYEQWIEVCMVMMQSYDRKCGQFLVDNDNYDQAEEDKVLKN